MGMNTYTKNALKIIDNIEVPQHLKASSPSKISLKENSAFGMLAGPQFSCPSATLACKDCYAMKKRHMFQNVQNALAQNWLLIKQLHKKRNTKRAVKELLNIIPKKAKIFRIHESGDWFSQWYINAWAEVVKQRPHTSFWFYTRSFKFNYSKLTRLHNLTMWASTDNYNLKEAKKFVKRYKKSGTKHAYGPWEHNKRIPMGSFKCPATSKKMPTLGACEKCMLCVVKKRVNKNVVFLKH